MPTKGISQKHSIKSCSMRCSSEDAQQCGRCTHMSCSLIQVLCLVRTGAATCHADSRKLMTGAAVSQSWSFNMGKRTIDKTPHIRFTIYQSPTLAIVPVVATICIASLDHVQSAVPTDQVYITGNFAWHEDALSVWIPVGGIHWIPHCRFQLTVCEAALRSPMPVQFQSQLVSRHFRRRRLSPRRRQRL